MLTPLVGMLFGGPSITTQNDITEGGAVLGRPVWDPRMSLAQLELRLGLPQSVVEEVVRLQRWTASLRELEARGPCFFSDSYSVDPLGTAKTLLEWRDELIMAGWNGRSVPGGGSRLDTLGELEARASLAELAPGPPIGCGRSCESWMKRACGCSSGSSSPRSGSFGPRCGVRRSRGSNAAVSSWRRCGRSCQAPRRRATWRCSSGRCAESSRSPSIW